VARENHQERAQYFFTAPSPACMGRSDPPLFSAERGSHLLREELRDSPDRPAGDASSGLVRVRERAYHKKFCLFWPKVPSRPSSLCLDYPVGSNKAAVYHGSGCSACHTRTTPSAPAEAMRVPSGDQATAVMYVLCS